MDVIVLGGGLMGTASAYFLARRGLKVTLVERNRVGSGATVASFGNIRRSGRYLPQLPLAHRSLSLWREAEAMLGQDVEFRPTGHLRLVFGETGLAAMRAFIEAARPWGLALDELDMRDVRGRFPGVGPGAIAPPSRPTTAAATPG
jgi:sarcosine oxidase subunit beta